MREGDVVQSYRAGIPKDLWESMGGVIDPGVLAAKTAWRGNCLPLHMIPIGTLIYNVGLHKDKGAQLCRSAGTFATVIAKSVEGYDPEADTITDEKGEVKHLTLQDKHRLKKLSEHVTLRLKSGEIRLIHKNCCATIGIASNANHQYRRLGKAGRKRWLGIRPTVRGLAMNAMDHPHGGGRGKSKGNVDPKSPWGLPAKSGYRTRPKPGLIRRLSRLESATRANAGEATIKLPVTLRRYYYHQLFVCTITRHSYHSAGLAAPLYFSPVLVIYVRLFPCAMTRFV
ncbi:54S ribosomal protein RML2 [Coccidioides immitis RMSCC 3703]|uniref:54S ribosomal protein RML2 n=1 Tax=Coccidioides immitis RMSCC 3703 TaxID=454286 RepID=A0A0J8QYC9_COCIT|nr:54S ribosomal protein RML2 [Coccidioides immitis RMSCC 3703]